jgi:hypothetical protein
MKLLLFKPVLLGGRLVNYLEQVEGGRHFGAGGTRQSPESGNDPADGGQAA